MVEVLVTSIKHDKKKKGSWRPERSKMIFTHDIYIKENLLAQITEFSNVAENKINTQQRVSI